MVPRATMLATKNRAGALAVSLLAIAVLLSACAPPGPRALLEGKDLLDAGKTAEAITALRTATTLMQTNATAWNYLGVAYHRAEEWTNAAFAYSQALRFNRDLLEVRFNLGCLALDQGNLEAAKTNLFTYTSRRPNDGLGWVKLGGAQLQSRDLVAAEKSFREALRVEARDVAALNGLGMVFVQKNRIREALEAFTAVVKLQPDYRPALLNLAVVLQQQNDRPGALQRYREYLALQPREDDWEAVNAVARALEPAANTSVRPATTPAGVNLPPTNNSRLQVAPPSARPAAVAKPEAQTNAVKVSVAASPVTRVASNVAPPVPEVVKLAPEPILKTVPDDKSLASVSNAAAIAGPTGRTASSTPNERKGLLSRLNPFRREAKSTTESSAAKTNSPAIRNDSEPTSGGRYAYVSPGTPKAGDRKAAEREMAQGQEAQRNRRTAEAIQHFRRAAATDASYFEAHYALGLVLFETRSFKASAAAWETAIAIRPDSADARYNFALTLKAAGYPSEAADELEKLLSLHPDEARGHLTLGNLCAEKLADKTRARLHYGKVLQLDPRNPQAQAIRYWLVANPG